MIERSFSWSEIIAIAGFTRFLLRYSDRLLAPKIAGFMLLTLFIFETSVFAAPASPQKHSRSATPSFVAVEAEGDGTSRDEAMRDARRNAVQQAVGLLSEGTDRVVDEKMSARVIQLSRAFIEKYEIKEERRESQRHHVVLKAWIRKENLLEGLMQEDPDKSILDGKGLLTSALTREQQIQEAAEMLGECFASIPYANYVRCGIEGDSFHASDGQLVLDVNFGFDREMYFSELVPQIVMILDYVAEASQKDVPFLFALKPGNAVTVSPPSEISSLSEYLKLMELGEGNRYIDFPDSGGFANVYVLTKNYYFNCYRIPTESLSALMESLLRSEAGNRLGGKVFGEADLEILFRSKAGQSIHEHKEPLRLFNVMLFTDMKGLKRSPWPMGKQNTADERYHALFVLPALGTVQGDDYLLIEKDRAHLSIELAPQDMNLIHHVESKVYLQR